MADDATIVLGYWEVIASDLLTLSVNESAQTNSLKDLEAVVCAGNTVPVSNNGPLLPRLRLLSATASRGLRQQRSCIRAQNQKHILLLPVAPQSQDL